MTCYMNSLKKFLSILGKILFYLFVFISFLLAFSIRWGLTTWQNLKMDEMIFELTAPLEGTGDSYISDYILNGPIPALLITGLVLILFIVLIKKRKKTGLPRLLAFIVSAVVLGVSVGIFWVRLDVGSFIQGRMSGSHFIEDQYADPNNVEVTFPEKKRNLIYIYLESMENTFADAESGGSFPDNLIPNLTDISMANENFSGGSNKLNGGISLPGTTWTMGAIFAETSGLPLKISVGTNGMSSMDSFFPKIRTIGDILEDEGYNQTFLLGSDASFGGRRLYFTEHGNYEFLDYKWAKEAGKIPDDYKVFWGYEDEKLFEYAKESLLKKASSSEPFNFTILTVDTHFEDGYVCELCQNEYPDNQYASVFRCSDRQVSEFIKWCEEQDFYENTTIVVSGDHPTMDSDFCKDVPGDYQRKVYTTYINAAAEPDPSMGERVYSTFDAFPTTLAALGATIDGERLGLGTNLFSSKQTLTEEFGLEYEQEEMNKRSAFLESIEETDITSEKYRKRRGLVPKCTISVEEPETASDEMIFRMTKFLYQEEHLDRVYLAITDPEKGEDAEPQIVEAELREDGDWYAKVNLTEEERLRDSLYVYGVGASGEEYQLAGRKGRLELLSTETMPEYLKMAGKQKDCALFFAVADEASANLTVDQRGALADLGLIHHPGFRQAFIGIIEDGKVILDENSSERLSEDGTLSDGSEYHIESQGFSVGRYARFKINGKTIFDSKERGLHVWFYDKNLGKVVDDVNFDTYLPIANCDLILKDRSLIFHKIKVDVENIVGGYTTDRTGVHYVNKVRLDIWDAEHPEDVESVMMTVKKENDEGEILKLHADIDSRKYEGKKVYIRAVGTNPKGREYVLNLVSREIR